jgi:hypothetical protein
MDENTDIALRGVRYAQDQFSEVVTQAEEFVREKPGQSLLIALLAGFILNRLPIGRLFGGLLSSSVLQSFFHQSSSPILLLNSNNTKNFPLSEYSFSSLYKIFLYFTTSYHISIITYLIYTNL